MKQVEEEEEEEGVEEKDEEEEVNSTEEEVNSMEKEVHPTNLKVVGVSIITSGSTRQRRMRITVEEEGGMVKGRF